MVKENRREVGRPRNPNGPKKTINVSVDPELLEAISQLKGKLKDAFGFKPTISQTIHYAIKAALERKTD